MIDGARPFYEALKKVEFSPSNYKRLLGLYENTLKETSLSEAEDQSREEDILYKVACQWLNDEDDWNKKNYEGWADSRIVKKKLKIGGIFPLSGTKYRAKELVPGTQ